MYSSNIKNKKKSWCQIRSCMLRCGICYFAAFFACYKISRNSMVVCHSKHSSCFPSLPLWLSNSPLSMVLLKIPRRGLAYMFVLHLFGQTSNPPFIRTPCPSIGTPIHSRLPELSYVTAPSLFTRMNINAPSQPAFVSMLTVLQLKSPLCWRALWLKVRSS